MPIVPGYGRFRNDNRRVVPFLVPCLVCLFLSTAGRAQDRFALVIGNSAYSTGSLRNPVNDADAVSQALKDLGFAVMLHKNADRRTMAKALRDFRRKLTSKSAAFFFYAGHGIQVAGENYLVPIGADPQEEYEVRFSCFPVAQVLSALEESESSLKVVVLDCCRNNPFKRSWSRSSSAKGLATINQVPDGTLIAFATAPGKEAADGTGKNSPYTRNLCKVLKSRPPGGLELVDAFRDASRAVKQEIGQRPWLNMEASLRDFYLWRPPAISSNSPPNSGMASPLPNIPALPLPELPSTNLEEEITNSIGMRLRLIPAGEFMMGSPEDEKGRGDEEGPQHRVRITKPFYIGITEVTVGQFRAFVEATGYKSDAERDEKGGWGWNESIGDFEKDSRYTWRNPGFPQTDDHPVVNVSWNDAVAFCKWLSRKEGRTYRLPTEAEWEYACRAGTTTAYYHGEDPEGLAAVGNVADETAKEKFSGWTTISGRDGYIFTAPVARFRPNAFGLYDMHGNVWEWCSDWYDYEYYASSPSSDPLGPVTGFLSRVYRGGAWDILPGGCRSAYRCASYPEVRSYNRGFRVARSLSGE